MLKFYKDKNSTKLEISGDFVAEVGKSMGTILTAIITLCNHLF